MLELTDLHKAYGATTALAGVSLTVRPGELVGFVGANGAGKSTTMRIAMGLLAADRGTVHWRGQPVSFQTRRRFGYMPEERGLYPRMRVVDQVAYFARLHGMARADAERAARELIERMDVVAKPTDYVQALSLGNQQRVQLAAALVHDPELLILDEPFSGLDPVGVDTMSDALLHRCRDGVAVLFSSHQLELVERICDRVAIIRQGRLVASGTLDELRARAGRRELEIETRDGWRPAIPGVSVVSQDGGRLRLCLDDPTLDQAVLAEALHAGAVRHFGWRQPPLAELYREAVAS